MPGVSLSYNDLKVKLGFGGPADRPGLAARMNERLFGERLAPAEVDALQQFIDAYPTAFGGPAFFETIALGASLPGFQWY